MIDTREAFWQELLAYIDERSVIPVVGPDLVLVDWEGRREPYHKLLARQLAAHHRLDIPADASLEQAIGAYRALGKSRQAVCRELGLLASRLEVGLPEPLRQLAQVGDFPWFVSFCTDNLLARALNQVRCNGEPKTKELAFTPSEASDLPEGMLDAPLVFSLFGHLSVLPKYVAGEEDQLEWIAALQIPEKRPARLFDALGKHHLLFLGCHFPDWLTRFVLRTVKNHMLSAGRDYSEYLVDAHADEHAPLVVFLRQFSQTTQVLAVDPVAFVAELAQRWQARQGASAAARPEPGPMPDAMPPGSLFISYASEDRPAALSLAADLQAAGLPVWLDRQQLDWGSDYSARIQHAIGQCVLFVPLLSRTAEQRLGFFRKEWAWACERNLDFTGTSLTFLCPLAIDDAPVFTSTEIPAAFKARHIEQAPAGSLQAVQRDTIVAAFHAMRRRMEARP